MNSPDDNPFAAPASHVEMRNQSVSYAIEPPDFVISADKIACASHVELPPICIVTGVSEDVISRTRIISRLYRDSVFAVVALLFVLSSFETSNVSSMMIVSLFAIAAIAYRFRNGTDCTVRAKWYVSEKYIRSIRTGQLILGGIAFAAATAVVIAAQANIFAGVVTPFLVALLVVCFLRPSPRLKVVGFVDGLYLLAGTTRTFRRQATLWRAVNEDNDHNDA